MLIYNDGAVGKLISDGNKFRKMEFLSACF